MSRRSRVGVVLVAFGEPAEPTPEAVRAYLERIFLQNMDLEKGDAAAGAARARQLAAARAPGLLEVYRTIGGSPLAAQADAQAVALEARLRERDVDARTYSAFQFTSPGVAEQVAAARADGVDVLVALPVYPLCGASTTVAGLREVRRALDGLAWTPAFHSVSGWHHHPDYVALRVESVRAYVRERCLDLNAADTLLYFSVHGTPVRYLERGNRYDRYVDEHTREIARRLGVGERYAVGFQNHTNRPIEWTQPDNEARLRELAERRLVVVPISFMHEQSETLSELDVDLRAQAESLGKEMHRVPVPHDDPRFVDVLASLVEELVGATRTRSLSCSCRCSDVRGTWCTNAERELPVSPFVPARA